MAKVWITRKELVKLIREEVPMSSVAFRKTIPSSEIEIDDELKAAEKGPSAVQSPRVAQMKAQQVSRKTSPSVVSADVPRSGWYGPKGKTDPTASKPYTKKELSMGADSEQAPKSGGLLNKLKGLFKGKEEKGGFEEPPTHWAIDQKEKFHRERAIGMRDRMKQYSKMFADANRSGDAKKKAHAQKMHKFYSTAAGGHEKALNGLK